MQFVTVLIIGNFHQHVSYFRSGSEFIQKRLRNHLAVPIFGKSAGSIKMTFILWHKNCPDWLHWMVFAFLFDFILKMFDSFILTLGTRIWLQCYGSGGAVL
jgi:hypothetical protein